MMMSLTFIIVLIRLGWQICSGDKDATKVQLPNKAIFWHVALGKHRHRHMPAQGPSKNIVGCNKATLAWGGAPGKRSQSVWCHGRQRLCSATVDPRGEIYLLQSPSISNAKNRNSSTCGLDRKITMWSRVSTEELSDGSSLTNSINYNQLRTIVFMIALGLSMGCIFVYIRESLGLKT